MFRIKVEISQKLCINMIKKFFIFIFNIDVLRPDRALPWGKQLYFAIWPCNPNYLSNVIFVIIVFANHENIGKETKIMVLLCTVQKLWLIFIMPGQALPWGKQLISAIQFYSLTIYQIMFSKFRLQGQKAEMSFFH